MDFRGIVEFLKDASKYIIVIVIVFILVIYVVSLQQVVGPSMNPTLKDGDVLVLNKLKYKISKVKRNDVIAFKYDNTKYLIKRVIALPGETISYKNNVLYINSKPYKEILYDNMITKDFEEKKVPNGMYFVMGDNRGDSLDSRDFGFIKKKDIIGKVFVRIWPLNKFKLVK